MNDSCHLLSPSLQAMKTKASPRMDHFALCTGERAQQLLPNLHLPYLALVGPSKRTNRDAQATVDTLNTPLNKTCLSHLPRQAAFANDFGDEVQM